MRRPSLRATGVPATLAFAVLTAAAAAAAPAQEAGRDDGDASSVVGYHGAADYDWRIRRLNGEPVELEAFRGEVLFINLWAPWCPPCVRELRGIEELRRRVSDTDVRFLIVSTEDGESVEEFLRRRQYDLPFYLELETVPAAFGRVGLPTTWVVDRRGRIVLTRHGAARWDRGPVVSFLRSLAAGG